MSGRANTILSSTGLAAGGLGRGLRAPWHALAVLLLGGAACRSAEPAPRPPERTPEQEARELVEQARREVAQAENAPAPVAASGVGLHVPPSASERLPLLVFLHGLGDSGQELAHALALDDMAAAGGFAYMAPDGKLDNAGRRFWNATDSCCNFEGQEVDHVDELRRWIEEALHDPRLDARRVYLVGFSNGGFLAYRAACEIGHLLSGIVSIAGAGP